MKCSTCGGPVVKYHPGDSPYWWWECVGCGDRMKDCTCKAKEDV